MIEVVRGLGLEGVIAKRKDSKYQPGLRTQACLKLMLDKQQEFVSGGEYHGLLSRLASGVIFISSVAAGGPVQRAFEQVIGSAMRTDSISSLEYCRIRREVEVQRFQSLSVAQLHRFRDLRTRFATHRFDEFYRCWSKEGDQALERFRGTAAGCALRVHRLDCRHYRPT